MIDAAAVNRPVLVVGALFGALGVGLAARASHAGEANLAIAANFLLFHAPVLLLLGLLKANRLMQIAAIVLAIGLALFAGDLAMRSEAGTSLFPFAAPAGGVSLIGGWLLVALGAWIGWPKS